MMNATAVPWPETTRRIIPSATVHSQTASPAGRSASGRRQARDAAQPAARPQRNGQEVDAIPARDSPLVWLARPMATKTSTQHTSSTTATLADRMTTRVSLAGGFAHLRIAGARMDVCLSYLQQTG